jgi:UDP-N-acetylglucosamine acyltransferase
MNTIHPTAIVSGKAKLGDNIIISPYAIVHDDVEIGDNCQVGPYAVIYDGARIGNNVIIHQSASVSNVPQDLSFEGEETLFYIGDNTTIREFVTLHKGTKSSGFSRVGSNCLIMAYSHVAHDCILGNNIILSNAVQIAGHVTIDDYAIVGGSTVIHQFCKVGKHTMTGGGFRIVQDLPPFILAAEEPLQYKNLNIVGLRRRGFSNEDIMALKKAYGYIYSKALNVTQAKEKIIAELGDNKYVQEVLTFIEGSKRGLVGK